LAVNFNFEQPGAVWIDRDGKPTREFWELIYNLWTRTGGPSDMVDEALVTAALARLEADLSVLVQSVVDNALLAREEQAQEDLIALLSQEPLEREEQANPSIEEALSSAGFALHGLNVAFGGIYLDNGATAETTTDTTPRRITHWSANMPVNRVAADYTAGTITVLDAGYYLVAAKCSFLGSTAKTYYVEIYSGTASTSFESSVQVGTAGEIAQATAFGIVHAKAGDVFSIYHSSPDGGSTFTAQHSQLLAIRIPSLL